MTYRHIVLFRVFDDVSESEVDSAVASLTRLSSLPGIVEWRVERSLDTRKGRVLVEDATFTDADAFEAFRVHPDHVRVAEEMSTIADWWNGDYVS